MALKARQRVSAESLRSLAGLVRLEKFTVQLGVAAFRGNWKPAVEVFARFVKTSLVNRVKTTTIEQRLASLLVSDELPGEIRHPVGDHRTAR